MLLRAPICFSFSEILYIYTPACHISTKISTHVMRINQIVSLHGPDNLRSHHEHCWVPKSAPILRNLAFHFAVGVANKANNQNLVGYKKKGHPGNAFDCCCRRTCGHDSPLLSSCHCRLVLLQGRGSICHAECPCSATT